MKVLSPTVHGVLDYVLALAFLLAPAMVEFGDAAATLSTVIGVVYLAASLLTRYPLGAIHMIPFPVHGLIESIMAAGWIAFPWLFGFAGDAAARNFFVAAGAGLLVVAALTDYRAAESQAQVYDGEERRGSASDRRQRAIVVAVDRRVAGLERRGYA
jgi:hypothetical protein